MEKILQITSSSAVAEDHGILYVSWNFANCSSRDQLKSCQVLHKCLKKFVGLQYVINLERHKKWRHLIGHISLTVVRSNNASIMQWNITTFTLYVTACDLEKSFIFDMTVEIVDHVHFPFMCKH